MAMTVLFAAHDAEFFGLFRIIRLQAVGEIPVDARILLFERDGKGEDFLFGKTVECFYNTINFFGLVVGRVISAVAWLWRDKLCAPQPYEQTAGRGLPALPAAS
jgi:hypothetical protein